MRSILSLVVIAALLSACRSNEHLVTEERQDSSWRLDSVKESVIRDIETVNIPAAEASMVISVNDLKDLPSGAGYEASAGRAKVRTTRQGEDLLIAAHCDSLEIVYQNLSRELHHYKSIALRESVTEKESVKQLTREGPSGWQWFQIHGFRVLLIINLLLLILKRLKIWQRLFY